jgi:uncharacterized protein YbcC (UPF0753/DUF2309 family)
MAIQIPEDTLEEFTTQPPVEFFNVEEIPDSHRSQFDKARHIISEASTCFRTMSEILACRTRSVRIQDEALKHVQTRSIDAAEVLSKLNHATNAAVIGRCDLTKGRFLDSRDFHRSLCFS